MANVRSALAAATGEEFPLLGLFRDGGLTRNNSNRTDDPLGVDAYDLARPVDALPPVNKDALNAAITEAEGLNEGDYTIPTWVAMQTALTNAKTVAGNASAVQGEVNTARDALLAAITALALISGTGDTGDTVVPTTIAVSFTLLGNSVRGENANPPFGLAMGGLQTWIPQTSYTLPSNSTVYDVFSMALSEAGMTYSNRGNYIESITRNGIRLAEFTNGKHSGWMYTLNGRHPSSGVNEQRLSDGDVIVFHYTDDFTKEASAAAWGTPSGTDEDEADGDTAGEVGEGSIVTEVEATVRDDGTAVVEVSHDVVSSLIQQAKENEEVTENVTISVTATEEAASIEVNLVVASVQELLDNNMTLTIQV
jgi:hypothetical protein